MAAVHRDLLRARVEPRQVGAHGVQPALVMAGSPPAATAVVRTLLPNGVAGVVFGLLFARRDFVAATLAHAGTHLGIAAAALAAGAWPSIAPCTRLRSGPNRAVAGSLPGPPP